MGRSRAAGGRARIFKPRDLQCRLMRDLVIVAAPLLMLWLLYCLWRAQHVLRTWCPAAATVWKSDYSDTERADDRMMGVMMGLPIHPIRRLTIDDVVFTDEQGVQRKVGLQHRVARGTERESVRTIWYHPADPQRVTAHGPGRWLIRALKSAVVLGAIFYWGPLLVG